MLDIVTFNLRYTWNGDGINSFISRAGGILNKIHKEAPDIICFHEGNDQNIGFLNSTLNGYDIVFNQRDEDFGGEGLAVAYKKDKFRLLELGFFWLSPTPYKPGSRFAEQSPCPRICQKLLFKRICDGRLFRVYNIHLDHVSDSARILGIQSVMASVYEDNDRMPLPFFIMGDFNAEPQSSTIAYCNEYKPLPIKDLTNDISLTFHGFGNEKDFAKIDYIYSDAASAKLPYNVSTWNDCINGIYLSDHYPVELKIEI